MTAIVGWASNKELPIKHAIYGLDHIERTSLKNGRHNMRNPQGEANISLTMLNGTSWLNTGEPQITQRLPQWLDKQNLPKKRTNIALASSTLHWSGSGEGKTSLLITEQDTALIIGTVGYITHLVRDYSFSPEEESSYPKKFARWITRESNRIGIDNTIDTITRFPYSLFIAIFQIQNDCNKLFLIRSAEHPSRQPSPYLFYKQDLNETVVFASSKKALNIVKPNAKCNPIAEKECIEFSLPNLNFPKSS